MSQPMINGRLEKMRLKNLLQRMTATGSQRHSPFPKSLDGVRDHAVVSTVYDLRQFANDRKCAIFHEKAHLFQLDG